MKRKVIDVTGALLIKKGKVGLKPWSKAIILLSVQKERMPIGLS